MKTTVAVSGGVDSVVLLDMLVNEHGHDDIVVAHFEHGIRGEDSKSDALFVKLLSQKYRVKFEIGYGNLTKNASEDIARQKRYDFLKAVAKKYNGRVVTAHHQDDLIETIAINVTRGTGWRGLAVFGNKLIDRPLLGLTKAEIYSYALKHNLEWVEDETNQTDVYLRNRLRRRLNRSLSDEQRKQLVRLYENQRILLDDIRAENSQLMAKYHQNRFFFIMIPKVVAIELLRTVTNANLTRPQLERMLLAIKTYAPGTTYEAGAEIAVTFTRQSFVVTNTSRVL